MKRGHGHTLFLRLLIVLTTLFLAGHASGQDCRRPVTLGQIIELLEQRVKENEIIEHIQQYKVDFVLRRQSLDALGRAGATRLLLNAIEENPFRELFFTFPKNGDVVTHYIVVDGWSKSVPNKHLWLFVHPKEGSDWVPQGDEVVPAPNCEWKHAIYLGRPGDPKVDFEIRAVWVDLKAHQELETYFKFQCRKTNNRYPDDCPGVRLPEGTPADQVRVLRVN